MSDPGPSEPLSAPADPWLAQAHTEAVPIPSPRRPEATPAAGATPAAPAPDPATPQPATQQPATAQPATEQPAIPEPTTPAPPAVLPAPVSVPPAGEPTLTPTTSPAPPTADQPPPAWPPTGAPTWSPDGTPTGTPPWFPGGVPAAEPPAEPRRSLTRVIGTLVALGLVLLAAGGVAIALAVRSAQPRGSVEPKLAVEGYLSATFFTKNADDARGFLCDRIRDDPGTDQVIQQLKGLESTYEQPRVSWTFPTIVPNGREASADVTLTLTTANEQTSTKRVTVLLVEDRGWWVCDIEPGPA